MGGPAGRGGAVTAANVAAAVAGAVVPTAGSAAAASCDADAGAALSKTLKFRYKMSSAMATTMPSGNRRIDAERKYRSGAQISQRSANIAVRKAVVGRRSEAWPPDPKSEIAFGREPRAVDSGALRRRRVARRRLAASSAAASRKPPRNSPRTMSGASSSTSTWTHGKTTREYSGHKKKVHSVAWSCTGAKLASGSVDQSVRVWTIDETGRHTDLEMRGHQDSVDQLRWDPKQPEVLGTASADKTVRIWDARSGKCAHAIETKGENINIRWSPDGTHIAVGDKDDNISLIEMRKCKILKNIKFGFEVNEMAWDPSGRVFLLTTGGGTVEVFNFADMLKAGNTASVRTIHAHTANCYCIEFAPSGEYFAVGSADALVSLWSLQELVRRPAAFRSPARPSR